MSNIPLVSSTVISNSGANVATPLSMSTSVKQSLAESDVSSSFVPSLKQSLAESDVSNSFVSSLKQSLAETNVINSKELKYCCNHCGKNFTTKSNLTAHLKNTKKCKLLRDSMRKDQSVTLQTPQTLQTLQTLQTQQSFQSAQASQVILNDALQDLPFNHTNSVNLIHSRKDTITNTTDILLKLDTTISYLQTFSISFMQIMTKQQDLIQKLIDKIIEQEKKTERPVVEEKNDAV